MKRSAHVAHLMRDYPNALRVRAASLRASVPGRWATGSARPVLLLPGVYETWHFLRVLGDALNAAGHPVHTVPELGLNRLAVPASSVLVARALEARDLRGVALVTHSKGGLIGKHLMTNDDPERRVDRLVAVATPFAGSAMARWTPWRTMRAFLPGDAVIRALGEHPNQRITSIYPRFDPNIPEGSRLEGATNIEIPVVGHFRVLDEPATVAAVLSAVGA